MNIPEIEMQNILHLYSYRRTIKTHIISFNDHIKKLASINYLPNKSTYDQFCKMLELQNEKLYVLNCFAILEEAIKDLKLNDFVIMEEYYFYRKHKDIIQKEHNISERTMYRHLQKAKERLYLNVCYYDRKRNILELNKYNLKFFSFLIKYDKYLDNNNRNLNDELIKCI